MKLKLAAAGIILVGLAIAATAYSCLPRDPINIDNFNRLKEGMTMAEVVAILGRPPDHRAIAHCYWNGSDGQYIIVVGWEKIVPDSFCPARPFPQQSFIDRLKDWLLPSGVQKEPRRGVCGGIRNH